MDFYKILQELMDEKGMKIPDVARACGLSDSTVRSIIERKAKRVSLDVAFKMHRGLNVSMQRLNGEDNSEEPAAKSGSGLSQIDAIFSQLSSDNRAKLAELALLYLDAQHSNEEKQ